ncbi:hypothetical protein [Deinococcus petrolearius]|uniref:DUF1440 domain-containing protein n=1 Tax=Deinococcus petrolearius TaxID=1751295 RepID=A0ABW1DMF2_9DEIO
MTTLRGVVTGLLGGAAGTLAMGQYWTRVARLVQPDSAPPGKGPDRHSIAPLGQLHEPGESSTAALGRLGYEALKGRPPRSDRLKSELSEGVHWSMGVLSGTVFGAIAAPNTSALAGAGLGAAFGAGLWAVMDEGVVPLLGLQDGPGAGNARGHLNRLGAHLFYGAALGLSAWTLARALPGDE